MFLSALIRKMQLGQSQRRSAAPFHSSGWSDRMLAADARGQGVPVIRR